MSGGAAKRAPQNREIPEIARTQAPLATPTSARLRLRQNENPRGDGRLVCAGTAAGACTGVHSLECKQIYLLPLNSFAFPVSQQSFTRTRAW